MKIRVRVDGGGLASFTRTADEKFIHDLLEFSKYIQELGFVVCDDDTVIPLHRIIYWKPADES